MSTTKQLKVYKGLPTIIKSRARGYYDDKTILTFNTDAESQNITMNVYDGLSYTTEIGNNTMIIDFSETILPYKWDYDSQLKNLRYYFLPIKNNQYTITDTFISNLNNLSNCPSSILDENNFTIIDNKLASGPKSYNVNNGYSYGYIEYTPTETLTITIKAYVSSEGNYDYGACYIGTQIYEATRSQITNGTTDENGEWIFKISGSTNETSYTKELIGGTTYYIQFYYTKDSSSNSGSDRLFITALENFNNFVVTKTETLPGCSANYTDDGSAVTLNCFANGDTSVILTPDNNYNGTYLGTVNIPAHNI